MARFKGELIEDTGGTFGGELVEEEQLIKSDDGFVSRVEKRFEERQEEVGQTFDDLASGVITGQEGAIQIAGKGIAGPALDILGEGVVSLGQGVVAVTPDIVKAGAESFFNALPLREEAAAAIAGGAKAWGEFKTKNPRLAKNMESGFNIAAMLAPVKAKKAASPSPIKRAADVIDEIADKQINKSKDAFIGNLITPKQTPKVKIDQVSRTREVGKGVLKRNIVSLSSKEQAIADVVSNIKGVSPKHTLQRNFNIIQKENINSAKKLERAISARRIPINKQESVKAIDNAVIKVANENPLIVGNAALTTERAGRKATELIMNSDGTAAGMLRARRAFDSWVRSTKGSAAFAEGDNALTIAVREIRNKMNDLTDDAVKRHGARTGAVRMQGVKQELSRQSMMFDAIENIGPKAADEHATAIGRAWQNAARVVPFKTRLSNELAVLFGMGGLGAIALFAPYISGALAVSGLTYSAGKMIMSPGMKKGMSKLLKMVDKAIISSENPSMIRQLRADRALIIEGLKAAEEE